MIKIRLDEVKDYVNKKNDKRYSPLRVKAQLSKQKIIDLIGQVKLSAEKFLTSKGREAFKTMEGDVKSHELAVKASEKLSNSILEYLNKIKIDENCSYNSLMNLNSEVKNFFLNINELGRKLVPKMTPWFKTELKDLDFNIRKLAELVDKTNQFLLKEYKEIERVDKIIDSANMLIESVKEKKNLQDKFESVKIEICEIEKQLKTEEDNYLKFKTTGLQKEHMKADEELNNIRRSFNMLINPVLKPLAKLTKSSSKALADLTAEQRNTIDKYILEPFNTFISETEGLPVLKQILKVLQRSLLDNELELKQDRADRAIKQISRILGDEFLDELYVKAKASIDLKEKLKTIIAEKGLIEESEIIISKIEEIEKQLADKKVVADQIETLIQNLEGKIDRDLKTLAEKLKEILGEEIEVTLA
ncbi:MAG: hypothetical protein QW739_02015 [Candidatus Odinarchaeota archaeon]